MSLRTIDGAHDRSMRQIPTAGIDFSNQDYGSIHVSMVTV